MPHKSSLNSLNYFIYYGEVRKFFQRVKIVKPLKRNANTYYLNMPTVDHIRKTDSVLDNIKK
jgi:hypothetical protein